MSFKYYSASLPTEQVLAFLFKTLECVVLAHLLSGNTLPTYNASLYLQQAAPFPASVPSRARSSAGGRGGGDRIKTKISSQPGRLLHKGRREDTFIKPESDAHPGQSAKGMRGQSATSLSYAARRTQPHSRRGAINPPGRWAARYAHSSA